MPMLERLILRETAESFELTNQIAIEIQAAQLQIDERLYADRCPLRRARLLAK